MANSGNKSIQLCMLKAKAAYTGLYTHSNGLAEACLVAAGGFLLRKRSFETFQGVFLLPISPKNVIKNNWENHFHKQLFLEKLPRIYYIEVFFNSC